MLKNNKSYISGVVSIPIKNLGAWLLYFFSIFLHDDFYFLIVLYRVMFGLKNHVNDLQYSERFYYTNYEFYNDYDNSKNYLNDISKVFHSCRRKTIPTVIKYHQKSES